MPILSRLVLLLAAIALCVPAVAIGQASTVPETAPGVSTQPPVELGDGRSDDPRPVPEDRAGELPDTGSDPRLLFLVGVALTLLGVGLRLRTADADLY